MAFTDFVQIELPKRPFVEVDGNPGQTLVRSGNLGKPRELVWVDQVDSSPKFNVTANNGVATVIDSIDLLEIRTARWIVTVIDSTLNKVRSSEILAHQTMAGDVRYSQSGIIGDSMTMQVSVVALAGNMELQIMNNNPHTITVKAVRVGSLSI